MDKELIERISEKLLQEFQSSSEIYFTEWTLEGIAKDLINLVRQSDVPAAKFPMPPEGEQR